jgi:DNA-binding NtrC family response regulator
LLAQYNWPGNAREVTAFARQVAATCPHAIVSSRDVERVMFTAVTGMTLPSHDPELSVTTEATQPASSAVASVVLAATEAFVQADQVDLPGLLRRIEGGLIEWALAKTNGQRAAASQLLGIRRTTLVEKLRRGVADGASGPCEVPALMAVG